MHVFVTSVSHVGLQRLKNLRLGEPGKETNRQKVLTKLCFFIATGRNAMVVVTCAIVSYVFKTHGQTPFVLTGAVLHCKGSLACLVPNILCSISDAV
jgi:hypothetical protein